MTTSEIPTVGTIVEHRGRKLRVTKVKPTTPERWQRGPEANTFEMGGLPSDPPTHTVYYEEL